ncbi:MAG: glycosyltransferase [Erysipelotrichaceae bacterium]|nr:glycosyltransferase [Erysipelotrichaceae bacterium]
MKKKIAFIIPDMRGGGSERMVSRLSYFLNDIYDITVILFDDIDTKYAIGCKKRCLHIPSESSIHKKIKNVLKRKKAIQNMLKNENIDLAISFTGTGNLSFGLCKTDTIKVISCRNYLDYCRHSKLYKFLLKKSNYLLCNSKEMCEDIQSDMLLYKNKILYLTNFFDDKKIQRLCQQPLKEPFQSFYATHKVIINISRFTEGKGHHHLLKAFQILKEDCKEAGLLIIGEGGKLEKDIHKMVDNNKFKDDILVVNFQDNPFCLLHHASVFALTSYAEGFPNSLVEAMLSQTGVVSSKCKTGAVEILIDKENQYGVLCSRFGLDFNSDYGSYDEEDIELASALSKFMIDDDYRHNMEHQAYKRGMEFSVEHMKPTYIKYINTMMEGNL